jgi:acetolactate synthase-1/2/3 large subunit
MVKITGAQAVVKALSREKIKYIFGIPGGATLPIYDVFYDSNIRTILARHEQCAAHMADGFARASGQTGVCIATSGPGATNLVTGIATAYMDSSPVVAFTGQVPRKVIGKDAFQEADVIGITTPITKHHFQLKNVLEIPKTVKMAFHIASTGRPGPVLIDMPKDIQIESGDMKFPEKVEVRGYNPNYTPHPVQVKRAAQLLMNAKRPLIIAGGGVIISAATNELIKIAEFLMAPIAITLMGKGCVPEDHPLFLGMTGMHGTPDANTLVNEADVILAVGTRFSDRTTCKLDCFCPEAKIIHVDIDTAEVGKNVKVFLPLIADAKIAMMQIYDALQKKSVKRKSHWFKRTKQLGEYIMSQKSNNDGYINLIQLISELRRSLPLDAIVTTEVGLNQMLTALYFKILKPRTFISSGGLGTMGFGFPAAIGAKVARQDVPVVDIAGDGSFLMTAQDLACSITEEIPVIVLIINNTMLGMVAQWQRLFYNRRYSATELKGIPDFVKFSQAFGAEGVRLESLKDLPKIIKRAINCDVSTVIDVPVSPEANLFPMVPAGAPLKDILWGKNNG